MGLKWGFNGISIGFIGISMGFQWDFNGISMGFSGISLWVYVTYGI